MLLLAQKKTTYEEAFNEAKDRLDQSLKNVFEGEDASNLGPLDPSVSVLENVGITSATADGASDGQYGSVASNATTGAITYNANSEKVAALVDGESFADTFYVSQLSSKITVSGTVEVGDTYRLTVDGYPVSYTVTEDDVTSGMDTQGLATAFVQAINEDIDIAGSNDKTDAGGLANPGILKASIGDDDATIILTPLDISITGRNLATYVASVSAANGDGAAIDDNDATYQDVFSASAYQVTVTNNAGSYEITNQAGEQIGSL